MPVKRRMAKGRRDGLTDLARRFLMDERPGRDDLQEGDDGIEWWCLRCAPDRSDMGRLGRPSLEELWQAHKVEVLEDWLEDSPGTRPSSWWRWDAPREPIGTWPGCWYDGQLPQPRRRLGGIGTPEHEVTNTVPSYHLGIPARWVKAWMVETYNGRALDVAGQPLTRHGGRPYCEGDFLGVTPDPHNPPLFESQASYLRRLGLLPPGEARRLTSEEFKPEPVYRDDDT